MTISSAVETVVITKNEGSVRPVPRICGLFLVPMSFPLSYQAAKVAIKAFTDKLFCRNFVPVF